MNRQKEKQRIIDSFIVFDVPLIYQELILFTIESKDWDWFEDMDGCSCVADYWPTKYNPACLVHDYYWRTGRGGYWSDKIFLELMKIYAMPKRKRLFRFSMVRFGWFGFFKWKHIINGNIRKLDDITKTIINKWRKI